MINDLVPPGWKLHNISCPSWEGGGFGMVFKNNFNLKRRQVSKFLSFRYSEVFLKSKKCIGIVLKYHHLPQLKPNQLFSCLWINVCGCWKTYKSLHVNLSFSCDFNRIYKIRVTHTHTAYDVVNLEAFMYSLLNILHIFMLCWKFISVSDFETPHPYSHPHPATI